jgi:hypothetical protein
VVIRLRERGVSVGAINAYLHGANAFVKWLAENGHCQPFSIKPLKGRTRVFRSLTDAELKAILTFRPKTHCERRTYALL